MLTHMLQYLNKMESIIFYFRGHMTQGLVYDIDKTVINQIKTKGCGMNISLTVFSVFVEQVQNVINYSRDRITVGTEGQDVGSVLIGYSDGKFFVSCSNLISSLDRPCLEEKLANIKNMPPNDLAAFFKTRKRSVLNKESKGAGLGLIAMARWGSKLTYDFYTMDSNYDMFFIHITI